MTFGFRFCSVLYGVELGMVRVLAHFFYFWVRIRFLAKPGFWFGSFLLGSASVPSLNKCPLCSQACNSSGAWCDYLHKHIYLWIATAQCHLQTAHTVTVASQHLYSYWPYLSQWKWVSESKKLTRMVTFIYFEVCCLNRHGQDQCRIGLYRTTDGRTVKHYYDKTDVTTLSRARYGKSYFSTLSESRV